MTTPMEWRHPTLVPSGTVGPAGQVNALLLCEDPGFATEPLRLLHRIGVRLEGDVDIEALVWSFVELEAGDTRAAVMRQAGNAGILAVAARHWSALPLSVRTFLSEALVTRLGRPTSLVLFSVADPAASPRAFGVERYLRQLALSAGATFFVTTIPMANPPLLGSLLPPASVRDHPALGFRHWGINE